MPKFYNFQQWTPEWDEIRKGCITWTKLSGVLAWPKWRLTAIYELIAEEFTSPVPTYESDAMIKGKELEAIARAKYEIIKGVKVEEVWFAKSDEFVDDYWEYVWISPDWITGNTWIEIKCVWPKNFVKYSIENKIPDEYYEQVMMYFIVFPELEQLDFIAYCPDFYMEEKQINVITITRKELQVDIEEAKIKIVEFRKMWIEWIKKLLC